MSGFGIGDHFRARERLLESPALADKLVRRQISRLELTGVLAANEIIEVYEHEDRVRCVLLGHADRRPLHVVVAQDDIIGATVVLSANERDGEHGWDPATGFRRRKEVTDDR